MSRTLVSEVIHLKKFFLSLTFFSLPLLFPPPSLSALFLHSVLLFFACSSLFSIFSLVSLDLLVARFALSPTCHEFVFITLVLTLLSSLSSLLSPCARGSRLSLVHTHAQV